MGCFNFFFTSLMLMVFFSQANSQHYTPDIKQFLSCFSSHYKYSNQSVSDVIYTPNSALFTSTLNLHIHNKRFKTQTTPKPMAIITAKSESHVQVTIQCAKVAHIQVRIRSGGHDYEGLSYVSDVPFVVLDMFPLNAIDVDIASGTTWVQAGATLGQLYYQIAKKSNVHAFPAGVCFSLGTGGHFSGGGYGNLMRKYGLSVDNIIDAKLVNAMGDILDRRSMGEDLFWAIRGGGGASFGVIVAWKIKLVPVPPQVTVFRVKKSVAQDATDVAYKWQLVAPKLDKNIFIRVQPDVVNGTVIVSFIGEFLGTIERLVPLVNKAFPELGLKQTDCIQMPWVNSTLFWFGLPIGSPIEALLPTPQEPPATYSKSKSDYVKTPIPKEAIKKIWDLMIKVNNIWMQWNPYGGVMEEISPSATPFPHRAGNLFLIQYQVFWTEDSVMVTNSFIKDLSSFYEFMTPYVSSSPREAFLNYRDIDIGAKYPSYSTSMDKSRTYGSKLFKENFDRLVTVKTRVDPANLFSYEQSIAPR
ncbi:hypothetical protein VNO78_11689 [Psophocarpus tetragonolobus]|uniref:FAD-binding PCMH-type domain-containing protein n=1 Tax=Psophocarpus tetragonolobus TaxID=3891 RepID=A0AAN9XNP6_PSOTE